MKHPIQSNTIKPCPAYDQTLSGFTIVCLRSEQNSIRDCSCKIAALVRHLVPDNNKRTLLIIWIISIWTTWVHLFSRKPRKYSFSETSTKQAYNRLINFQQQFHESLMQHFYCSNESTYPSTLSCLFIFSKSLPTMAKISSSHLASISFK